MIKSKALEVNLAGSRVDVDIDPKYATLQEIMSRYFGLMEGFNTFLKELSHPYGRDFRNAGIKPDDGIPFMLVFTMPDEEASELVVELIGIEASQSD